MELEAIGAATLRALLLVLALGPLFLVVLFVIVLDAL